MSGDYLFAGDRAIALRSLHHLIEIGDPPKVLCVSDRASASHAAQLEQAFKAAGGSTVVTGSELRSGERGALRLLEGLDFALSVHFPELVKRPALNLPRRGWLNLHPAYLPYNRGWHTPSWSILEGTPAGATLHQMVEEVDAGAIFARVEVPVRPFDTADTLYQRLLEAEFGLLVEQWPLIRSSEDWPVVRVDVHEGSLHHRTDLGADDLRRIDLGEIRPVEEVIGLLRALTTNRWSEAAYIEQGGRRILVRVEMCDEANVDSSP